MNLDTDHDTIVLEGVRVHNLKDLSLEIPLHQLVVVTGISGSGKSSLVFDTLALEGQRRYIETLSPAARGRLDRLDRPDADRIERVPPTIAIRQSAQRAGASDTVATATEISELLNLLFARIGTIVCPECQVAVESSTAQSIAETLDQNHDGRRVQVAFEVSAYEPDPAQQRPRLAEDGFRRLAVNDTDSPNRSIVDLDQAQDQHLDSAWVILDRLQIGRVDLGRIQDSVQQALGCGEGHCLLLCQPHDDSPTTITIDATQWIVTPRSTGTTCNSCQRRFAKIEPRLFSFHSPLGACPDCRGFGSIPGFSFQKLVPNPNKSLREGAIAAWTTPAYSHELDELLELAHDYQIPVDIPFSELTPQHLELIARGVPERDFGGLDGFFDWLQRHRYKLPVRVFLSRWRTYDTCTSCQGTRLQPDALAVHLPKHVDQTTPTIDQWTRKSVAELKQLVRHGLSESVDLPEDLARTVIQPLLGRLDCLSHVGLDYLTLDRPLRSLSGGETRRVKLTQALGSNLVNTLYVLDEPTTGLHFDDIRKLLDVLSRLVDLGNTVIVIEHNLDVIKTADWIIDLGPEGGDKGGEIIACGSPEQVAMVERSYTGQYLKSILTSIEAHKESA
jgi:excinuclease ABC subunit A